MQVIATGLRGTGSGRRLGLWGQPARDRSCSARIGTAKVFATSFSVGQLLRLGQVRAMRVRRAVIGDVAGGAVEGGKGILGDLLVGHATRAREAFRLERRAGAGVDQDKPPASAPMS